MAVRPIYTIAGFLHTLFELQTGETFCEREAASFTSFVDKKGGHGIGICCLICPTTTKIKLKTIP